MRRFEKMKKGPFTTENIEEILSESRFTDRSFKESLKARILKSAMKNDKFISMELSLDDLEMAAGGRTEISQTAEDPLKEITKDS